MVASCKFWLAQILKTNLSQSKPPVCSKPPRKEQEKTFRLLNNCAFSRRDFVLSVGFAGVAPMLAARQGSQLCTFLVIQPVNLALIQAGEALCGSGSYCCAC